MDEDRRIEELEQALRDERAERETAQRRAAQKAERAEIWETRAVERSARIERLVAEREQLVAQRERLVAEREQLRTVGGWLRARRGRRGSAPRVQATSPARIATPTQVPPPAAAQVSDESEHPPAYPAVQVVAIVDDPLVRLVLNETDLVAFEDDPGALVRADLVVAEPAAVDRLDEGGRTAFHAWRDAPGRQPLATVAAGETGSQTATARSDLSIDREWRPGDSAGIGGWEMRTSFDAQRWSPAERIGDEALAKLEGFDRELIDDRFSTLVVNAEFDPSVPWMTALAAAGTPFLDSAVEREESAAERLGSLNRRITHRERAPWILAAELLARAGVSHEPAIPMATGVLVSNRPDRVVAAIEQFGRQTYPRAELVVGCHGFSVAVVAAAVDALSDEMTVTVLEFVSGDSLGRCLNAAIEATGSSIIAKIDDDDHYGPGYLEDAVQAVRYAQAPLVGKGATFTYLESRDATYLRRPAVVERFYNGSPTGASLVFERHLWERVAFPHRTLGEDLAFVRGAKLLGVQPYATSPWEFVYHRAITGNTWDAIDEVFLEGAIPAWSGDRPDLADLAVR
jgi:hypothetical protein